MADSWIIQRVFYYIYLEHHGITNNNEHLVLDTLGKAR